MKDAQCAAVNSQRASSSAIAVQALLHCSVRVRMHTIYCPDPYCVSRPRAVTDFTSVFITWVTGHVTETLPDIPYTATSVYNVNPLNKSAPGVALSCSMIIRLPVQCK